MDKFKHPTKNIQFTIMLTGPFSEQNVYIFGDGFLAVFGLGLVGCGT